MNKFKKHSHNVALLSTALGEYIGLNEKELNQLALAAEYHDIGKKVLIQKVLFTNGKFKNKENEIMKRHSIIGAEVVKKLKMDQKVIEAVKHHHERWDGKGYPDGLKGNDIPLFSRIISIADAYDVMVSGRSYQKPMKPVIALSEILKCSGTQFDPELVKVFINNFRKEDAVCLR